LAPHPAQPARVVNRMSFAAMAVTSFHALISIGFEQIKYISNFSFCASTTDFYARKHKLSLYIYAHNIVKYIGIFVMLIFACAQRSLYKTRHIQTSE